MRALILGGTAPARDLAEMLVQRRWEVTSSLAGRVANPRLPVGGVRIGGFGGPAGLARWIVEHRIDAVVDATHPFAEKISTSALEATTHTGTPLVVLHRPPWEQQSGDTWIEVDTYEQAAAAAARSFHHILVTIGRRNLAPFAADNDNLYVIRCVDKPNPPLPKRHRVVLSRGPFDIDGEKQLFKGNQIDAVVTKNSGGEYTYPKIAAARQLRIPVIMIQRPALRTAPHAIVVSTPRGAVRALNRLV